MEKITAVKAIKDFFFDHGEPASDVIKEIKKLTPDDRRELAEGAAKALGKELVDQAASSE
jgi:hypothetical protein